MRGKQHAPGQSIKGRIREFPDEMTAEAESAPKRRRRQGIPTAQAVSETEQPPPLKDAPQLAQKEVTPLRSPKRFGAGNCTAPRLRGCGRRGEIPDASRNFPTASPKGGVNDDVKIEAYRQDAISYADKRRKGIHEAFGGCHSFTTHVRRAMKQPSRWHRKFRFRRILPGQRILSPTPIHTSWATFGIPNWLI